jgi:anaerobic selenocysteine-containing dehydrogenase
MVSVDPYLNETTCHADVILPPRSGLENFQYSVVFNRFAVRNVAKLAWPVFEPAPGALSEWQILGSLCAALARVRSRCGDAADRATVEDPSASYFASAPEDIVGAMLASGPYGLSKEDLAAAPSGLDLGPLQEQGLASSLVHPDGRIKLAHKETDREFGRLSSELESMDGDGGSIVLIGRRQLRSNNSWMHNCPSLIKGGERCTLLLNPEDARSLGIFAGGRVRVRSRVGEVEASAETSDEMMSGVASLPHGFGHWRRGTRMKLARESAGVSMNDLADEEPLEGLVGNAILNGIPVELTPL